MEPSDTAISRSIIGFLAGDPGHGVYWIMFRLMIANCIASFIGYMIVSAIDYATFYKQRVGTRWSIDKINVPVTAEMFTKEIKWNAINCVGSSILASPWIYVAHFSNVAKTYHSVDEHGWAWLVISTVSFFAIGEVAIYWIHRSLHTYPLLYRLIHKKHHEFVFVDSFAGAAFNPVDSFLQGFPYFAIPIIMPMHEYVVLLAFVFVICWSVSIHDRATIRKWSYVNDAAHHHIHHTKFTWNYGQVTTFMDRINGTHWNPYR